MKKKSINRITMYNILSTILLQGIAFFTSPVFSRLLGKTNYGIVSIYNTWVLVISVSFGLQTHSTIAVAKNEFPEWEQKAYQSSILSLSLSSYLIFSVIMMIVIFPLSNVINISKFIYCIMLLHGIGQFCVTFINIKFTYEFDAGKNFILSLITSLCSIGLSMFLIFVLPKEVNHFGRILGNACTYILLSIIIIIFIFSSGRTGYKKKYWTFCIPLCIPIVFHNLSGLILNQSDRVMLQVSTSYATVGIYSLAYSFGSILSTIWNALNNSWVPFYYDFTRNGQNESIRKHAINYTELYTILSIGFILLTPEVYRIFAAEEYWEGTRLISLFSIGFYMIFLYSFAVNYEFFNKKTKVIAIGTSITALINIILNLIMIEKYGMKGAAISTAVSYSIQYLFHIIFAKRIEKTSKVAYQFSMRMFIPYVAIFLCTAFICYHIDNSYALIRWGTALTLGVIELIRVKKRKAIF